jgi:hypothetical protein
MKRPAARISTERSPRSPRGRRLRVPAPDILYLQALAARATFSAYEKHKAQPRRFGLPPYTGARDEETTYCDADAGFAPGDAVRIPRWLSSGILAGLVGKNDSLGDPSLVWVLSEDGWIFEGRITMPGRAQYHGYPVLPNEAIAIEVLERYSSWGRRTNDPQTRAIAESCRSRYIR